MSCRSWPPRWSRAPAVSDRSTTKLTARFIGIHKRSGLTRSNFSLGVHRAHESKRSGLRQPNTLLRLPAHCETHRTLPTMSRRPCARREQRWERAHGSQCLHGRPFLPHAFASRAVAQCPLERTNVSAAEHPLRAESRGLSCRGRGYGRYSLLRCTCDSRQPPPTTAPAPKQQTHAFTRVQVSAEGMTHR